MESVQSSVASEYHISNCAQAMISLQSTGMGGKEISI